MTLMPFFRHIIDWACHMVSIYFLDRRERVINDDSLHGLDSEMAWELCLMTTQSSECRTKGRPGARARESRESREATTKDRRLSAKCKSWINKSRSCPLAKTPCSSLLRSESNVAYPIHYRKTAANTVHEPIAQGMNGWNTYQEESISSVCMCPCSA